jgi:hypothetical protein
LDNSERAPGRNRRLMGSEQLVRQAVSEPSQDEHSWRLDEES